MTDNTLQFAKDAVRAVVSIVSAIANQEDETIYGILRSQLFCTEEYLNSLRNADHADVVEWMRELLKSLEELCKYGYLKTSPIVGDPGNLNQYPTLRLLIKDRQSKTRLNKLARRKKRPDMQLKIIGRFQRLSAHKRPISGIEPDPKKRNLQRPDCQSYTRALYSTLLPLCLCSLQGKDASITANLQLRSCCARDELQDGMSFRLFFLDHPHCDNQSNPPHWQDVRVSISRRSEVRFQGELDTASTLPTQHQDFKAISPETFCGVITNRKQTQLGLLVAEDGVIVSQTERERVDGFLLKESSVSLNDLIKHAYVQLNPTHKVLLSYILAKSFWQLYSSEWMRYPWTKHDVHFMLTSGSSNPTMILVSEPFLSTKFKHYPSGSQKPLHPFPKILALGTMFLEIGLGKDLETSRPEFLDGNGKPTPNTSYYTAREEFNEHKETNEYILHFGRFIKYCIDLDYFVKYTNDVEGLRRAIETDIVNVLYSLYSEWDKDPDIDEVKPISLAKYTDKAHFVQGHAPSQPAKPSHLSCCNFPASNSTTFTGPAANYGITECAVNHSHQVHAFPELDSHQTKDSRPPTSAYGFTMSKETISSDHWFHEFDNLYRVIRCPIREVRRVKIAILDTGVLKRFKRLVSEYKDFVSRNDSEFQDSTGHGTAAVSLITRIYPDAEIYIGRVFEKSDATEYTAALMADAIMYAKNQWGAEIIVMASGFDDDNAQLEHAIDEARHAGILIFAAASNYGNLKQIAFPARTYIELKLFCMFSTKPNVRDTDNLNPSPNVHARYSFAILGEDIELPSLGGIMSLSGTSYSTMIGAAVAGLILEFVRHPDTQGRIERGMRLSTVAGMSAVFNEMATRGGNGLDCIAPWKILPEHLIGEQVDIKAAREDIITTINRALRKR